MALLGNLRFTLFFAMCHVRKKRGHRQKRMIKVLDDHLSLSHNLWNVFAFLVFPYFFPEKKIELDKSVWLVVFPSFSSGFSLQLLFPFLTLFNDAYEILPWLKGTLKN